MRLRVARLAVRSGLVLVLLLHVAVHAQDCSNETDGTPCDDAVFCNGADSCGGGACVNHTGNPCPGIDGDANCAESCNEALDTCTGADPNGVACNDGLFCNGNDRCAGGACAVHLGGACPGPDGDADCAESCDEATDTCIALDPADSPCSDGLFCTANDRCTGGTCSGTPRDCSGAGDECAIGICSEAAQQCLGLPRPNDTACDDTDACTDTDRCVAGICAGVPIAGCCIVDSECDDGASCTSDSCLEHRCVREPHPERCAADGECAEAVCAPEEPGAAPDGCLVRALAEGAFCTEDSDPCTSDACRTGACTHESDGSGARCADLRAPFETALTVEANSALLLAEVATGLSCPSGPACVSGSNGARLVTLLAQVHDGAQTAVLALSGRLSQPGSSAPTRDPALRARLAREVVLGVPGTLRAFIATLPLVRTDRAITTHDARARRQEARKLMRQTSKLKRQLRRVLLRRGAFVR